MSDETKDVDAGGIDETDRMAERWEIGSQCCIVGTDSAPLEHTEQFSMPRDFECARLVREPEHRHVGGCVVVDGGKQGMRSGRCGDVGGFWREGKPTWQAVTVGRDIVKSFGLYPLGFS